MGQLGNVPEMLSGYSFLEDKEFSALSTKDNFDGGGDDGHREHRHDGIVGFDAVMGVQRKDRGVPNMEKIAGAMMHHSRYLNVFLRMHNHVLKGDGPLSYELRHFIAMMAASRHQCSYLFRMEAEEFLNCGGDSRWLNFTDAPEKLKALSNLNKVMAHRPWLLNKQMVQDLVSRTGDNSRSWCLSELVHVIVILSHFHSLSSFIYATGIEETECVCPQSQDAEKVAKVEEPEDKLIQERVQYLMNQMKSLSERERDEDWADDPEERNKRFVAVMETEESAPGSPPSGPSSLVAAPAAASPPSSPAAAAVRCATPTADAFSNVDGEERSAAAGCRRPATSAAVGSAGAPVTRIPVKKGSEALAKFLTDPEYVYQDFVSRYQAAVCPTLRIQDCSWEDQGFSLLSRLYSETSSVLLDDKHRTAYNLTYNTLSTIPNVDTSKFRRAVWNYILCLYGIRHDDYNYQEVNQLLQRELKTFIKRACCYPERLSGKDLRCAMKELQYSEKVHVLLMVMEARMEAELLYALRAVMQHLT